MSTQVISLVPGNDWEEFIDIDGPTGNPIDYSGWTVESSLIKWTKGGSSIPLLVDLAQAAIGRFRVYQAHALTATLPIGQSSSYSLIGRSPAGKVVTIYFARVAGVPIVTLNQLSATHLGEQGIQGLSAYQVAVEQGFEGTVEEWLESLVGLDGRSAYDTYVALGGQLSEADWNAAVNANRVAAEQAAQTATDKANLTAADRVQTGLDRAQTGLDIIASGASATAAAVSAAQALSGAVFYATTTAGLAGTTNGQYFRVPTSTDFSAYTLYQNVSGVATPVSVVISASEFPLYTRAGGQGDRTASIIVTSSAGLLYAESSALNNNLVDGDTTQNNTGSTAFLSAQAAAGHTIRFDFGRGARRLITEATGRQGNVQTHGVWQWQGSDDAATWISIGSTFTLGGATAQVQATLAANARGYRYYQLLGVSGTTNAGPYLQEIEFKVGKMATDGFATLSDISRFPANFPISKLVSAYFFDEAVGTVVQDVAQFARPIDLALPTSPNVTITAKGAKLANGLIQTPSLTGTRCQTILYRVNQDEPNFIISGGQAGSAGIVGQYDTPTASNENNKVGVAGFDLRSVIKQSTGYTQDLCTGGWTFFHRELPQAYTSAFGFGGLQGATTNRAAEYEINCAFIWSSTLTAAELAAVQQFVRQRAVRAGIYFHRADCPSREDVIAVFGESNADGRSPLASLSAADLALQLRQTQIAAVSGNGHRRGFDALELGYNQQATAPATQFGPEFGAAVARRSALQARTTSRKLRVVKAGVGSTRIAPTSTGLGDHQTWNDGTAVSAGLLYHCLLRQMLRAGVEMMEAGIGFDAVSFAFLIGLNDATSTIYTTDNATYQGYLQAIWNKLGVMFAGPTLAMKIYRAHTSDPASNATALGHVRTGTAAFAAANPGVVTMIDTDAYGLVDSVHYTAASMRAAGVTLHG